MSRLWRLTRKELSESLRDRRTVLTLVLMPLLLYPVLAIAFQQFMLSGRAAEDGPEYSIGFPDEETGRSLTEYWGLSTAKQPDEQVPPYRRPAPRVKLFVGPAVEQNVEEGHLDVAARFHRGEPGANDGGVVLMYRADSPTSCAAVRWLELRNHERFADEASKAGVLPRVYLRPTAVPAPPREQPSLIPVLVPLVLILMTMTGAVYPAIDLTAGERERGTLEILVAAPIPRLSVLLAKYFAVVTVALLTAVVNLGMMALTLWATGLGRVVFGPGVTWLTFGQVLALLVLFAMFFSAVLLALCSFARSFKEAQAYLIPLMLLSLTPGVLSLTVGLSLEGPLAVVPLLNIVLLARDVFAGTASVTAAGVVVLFTLLYALAAIALAARLFGTEAVLSADTGGMQDLFRRPDEPQGAATPAGALLCLAVMFPLAFLLTAGLARMEGLTMFDRQLLSAAVTVGVFGLLPLAALWLGRVRPVPGLGLSRPPASAWLAGALLGASAWVFAYQLAAVMKQAGLTTLGPDQQRELERMVTEWRGLPAWLLLLTMAVLPAVFEEMVFRGLVFRALQRAGASALGTIVATAALFGAFHVFLHGGLAAERFGLSLLMGLLLGALAWASGSVWPGIVLHALHNATLTMLAYHEPQLIEAGWLPGPGAALPPAVVAGAAVVAGLGGAVVYRLGRGDKQM